MTRQIITYADVPNAGLGVLSHWDAVNANFAELYDATVGAAQEVVTYQQISNGGFGAPLPHPWDIVNANFAILYAMLNGGTGSALTTISLASLPNIGLNGLPSAWAKVNANFTELYTLLAVLTPTVITAPFITGSPVEGQTLTANHGTYTGSPTSYAIQWRKDTVNIGGSTGLTYALPVGAATHSYDFTEIATNTNGPGPAQTAAAVGPVTAAATTTTPVLARTSSAGAAPLTWTTTLNWNDTYEEDWLQLQVATDSGFTAIVQDIDYQLQPGDYQNTDIDFSSAGFVTPSGTYYLRIRVKRDNGAAWTYFPWSNALTDTISAAATVLSNTAKSSWATASGTPRLTFVGTTIIGQTWMFDLASNATTGKHVFELTLTTPTSYNIMIGITDTSNTNYTGDSGRPGLNAPGAGCFLNSGGYGVYGGSPSGGGAYVPASGDVLTCKYDTVTTPGSIIISFFARRGGTEYALGTTTVTGVTNAVGIIGVEYDDTVTANFGQSAFARPLDTGYTLYA
jgi:hypothetical protein